MHVCLMLCIIYALLLKIQRNDLTCKRLSYKTFLVTIREQELIPCLNFQGRRDEIFKQNTKYKKIWKAIQKRDAQMSEEESKKVDFERRFLAKHIQKFFSVLDSIHKPPETMEETEEKTEEQAEEKKGL